MKVGEATPPMLVASLHGDVLDEQAAAALPPPPWRDVVRMYGGEGLGEVRTVGDWASFPRGRQVRVLVVEAGGELVLRWATDERIHDLLGGMGHFSLTRQGDSGRIWAGFVRMDADGGFHVQL